MADYHVKILEIKKLTHDVNAYTVEKPEGFVYAPGQATEVSIVREGWEKEKRPFTFTSLPDAPTLEFTIKSYKDHQGVTDQLSSLVPGDTLEIGDAWGTIEYKGTGVFLAGGAGVTPFIAIFRNLFARDEVGSNALFFSNKTPADIILKEEFENILGGNFVNVISGEKAAGFYHGHIDKDFLRERISNFDQPFYVCGPDAFNSSVMAALEALGASPEALVFEE